MDVFDGNNYKVQMKVSDRPLAALKLQSYNYCDRGIMALATVAMAFGDKDRFEYLLELADSLFRAKEK